MLHLQKQSFQLKYIALAVRSFTMAAATAVTSGNQPWYMSLPAPKSTANLLQPSTVLQWLEEGKKGGHTYLLVDVRRNDHEGGTIAGAINLPAQSFLSVRPTLFRLLKQTDVKSVAFYCGSSTGRGPRVAGWFKDYVDEQESDSGIEVLTLEGGVKGWVKNGEKFTKYMDDYDPDAKIWKD